jgi:hypothetical protein
MSIDLEQALRGSVETLLALSHLQLATLGAKTLPLLLASCYPGRGRVGASLLFSAFALALAVVLSVSQADFGWRACTACGALVYYVVAASCCFPLFGWVDSGTLRKDALFCLLAVVFVFGPAPLLRAIGQSELLFLGWIATLSAYSYCVETSRSRDTRSLRQFLFFVLIDPTVSFPERAKRVA